MSTNKFFTSVNLAGVYTMRQKSTRLHRVENTQELFISVTLVTPDKNDMPDSTYSVRLQSEKIVTNNGTIALAELPDNAMVAFKVTIASPENTDFSHVVLKDANSEKFIAETEFTVYTDGITVNGILPHVGYDMPEKQALAFIRNHVSKLGKTQQWKKSKGEYSVIG